MIKTIEFSFYLFYDGNSGFLNRLRQQNFSTVKTAKQDSLITYQRVLN